MEMAGQARRPKQALTTTSKESDMESTNNAASVSKVAQWVSYIMSAVPVFMLLLSAGMKLTRNPQVMEGMPQMGYPVWEAVPLGVVELVCTILYLIPRTSVLGAILLTGYLGGATATHVRIEDPSFIGAVSFGVLLWGGLYLRDVRIRALIPLRAKPAIAPPRESE